jgi:CHAT domain-containing protein
VLEAAVKEVYQRITARNRILPFELPAERRQRVAAADAALPAALARLGRLLLGPVWPTAAGRRPRLVVVGDGALLRVPFAALPGPDGLPLAASRQVVLLPSAAVLAELRRPRARRAPGELVVVADPIFSTADSRLTRPSPPGAPALPRLPATRREALAVASMVPEPRRLLALDFDAERGLAARGTLARYRVLHLATHALVDDRDPRLTGVVLSLVDAEGRPQDGVLSLDEISRLELAAELVVLSACRTALGRELRGEGLLGLTRAFFNAGARRVVATLWEVQDEATAVLMERFYRAYLGRGLPPGEALRQAQRSFLADPRWSDPYYWSGFVLQGEWR